MRVAVLSVHTSPLAQPGTGDAGGMNVYVLQTALELARRGVEVEIFTRATSSADPPIVRVAPGVLVRNVVAGPFEGLDKYDLPTQLCAFTAGVLRAEATHEPGYYDIVHSHYWLSGQVGWLARDRWAVPLVHTAHTLAAVKNAALAKGDSPEPPLRAVGEQQVVDEADRLIVNTEDEARQLVSLHHADPDRIDVAHPGVDLTTFTPGDKRAARAALGLAADERIVAFVGRIQPLKAPDVLLRAAAKLPGRARRRSRAAPRAAGWPVPTAWFASPTNWASPTGSRSCPRSPASNWSTCTAPPMWSRCRAIRSRSGSSPSRRRRAARPWWPPPSAGCRSRCATGSAACWCPVTTPTTGRPPSTACSLRGPETMSAAAVEHAAHVLLVAHRRCAAGLLRPGHHRLPGPPPAPRRRDAAHRAAVLDPARRPRVSD